MSRKIAAAIFFAGLTAAFTGCAAHHSQAVVQVSTMNALLAGSYDGSMTVAELRRHGDLGLGTFDKLDGEMVMDQGRVWQVKANGQIEEAGPDAGLAYAAAIRFSPSIKAAVSKINSISELERLINSLVPNKRTLCAFRLRGNFAKITTRSVRAQGKPYPPLIEVIAHGQSVFENRGVAGVLVGFRAPAELKGVTVPDYHFHMISKDRLSGGHVLEVSIERGMLEVDSGDRLLLILPSTQDIAEGAESYPDRSTDIDAVERGWVN